MASGNQDIVYPLEAIPDPGEAIEVAPGILWIRMPLPFRLNHINLWLLEDGDGWTLVDTGMPTDQARAAWQQIFERVLGGKPIRRVIVTHFHSDHAGLAGWIAERFDAPLWMSAEEWNQAHRIIGNADTSWAQEVRSFFHRAGCPAEMVSTTQSVWSSYSSRMSPIPELDTVLSDGMTLDIGGRSWQVMIGRGHAPEHVSLYCAEAGIMIAGDQILPRISPNISLSPLAPEDDPLGGFLATTRAFRARLPAETFVLPSHNEPFTGVHARLDDLLAHHDERLATTRDACAAPIDAYALSRQLFADGLDALQTSLAISETLAHLNRLMLSDAVARQESGDGVWIYNRS